jgi:hypothetical protein
MLVISHGPIVAVWCDKTQDFGIQHTRKSWLISGMERCVPVLLAHRILWDVATGHDAEGACVMIMIMKMVYSSAFTPPFSICIAVAVVLVVAVVVAVVAVDVATVVVMSLNSNLDRFLVPAHTRALQPVYNVHG